MTTAKPIPAVSFQTARRGVSAMAKAFGVCLMQERSSIGLRFRNHTVRLEKLCVLDTKLTGRKAAA